MLTRIGIGTLVLSVILLAGCTGVQKGAAAGAGLGGALGGAAGHQTHWGGGPGILLGLGAGGIAGAIAAEAYYGDDATEVAAVSEDQLQGLRSQLEWRHAENQELQNVLEQEKEQRKALLEANEEMRRKLEELQKQFGENVVVSRESEQVTLTILSEVLFDSGKASLTERGKIALGDACSVIRSRFPNAFIEVRGHTDNVPIKYSEFTSNWELSCTRALAVLDYMIEAEGLPPDRFSATGYGATRPVADNDSPEGRRQNRRAEIVIKPQEIFVAERRMPNLR